MQQGDTMRKVSWLSIGVFLIFIVTACIAEDYDVGPPTAHLYAENASSVRLTEANISWASSSGDVSKTVDDIWEFALSQKDINASRNEKVFLDFEENKENGGDIWTNPTIAANLWKEEQKVELKMNENREFEMPKSTGRYVLEVTFTTSSGTAQYVGSILVK